MIQKLERGKVCQSTELTELSPSLSRAPFPHCSAGYFSIGLNSHQPICGLTGTRDIYQYFNELDTGISPFIIIQMKCGFVLPPVNSRENRNYQKLRHEHRTMPYKGKNGHIWTLHSKEIFDICTWAGTAVLLPPFWKAGERIFALNLTYIGILWYTGSV